jgi:hypothetical protein
MKHSTYDVRIVRDLQNGGTVEQRGVPRNAVLDLIDLWLLQLQPAQSVSVTILKHGGRN